jgi:hypothetical protein
MSTATNESLGNENLQLKAVSCEAALYISRIDFVELELFQCRVASPCDRWRCLGLWSDRRPLGNFKIDKTLLWVLINWLFPDHPRLANNR